MTIDHAQMLAAPRSQAMRDTADALLASWRRQCAGARYADRIAWADGLRLVADLRDQRMAGLFRAERWLRDAPHWSAAVYGAVVIDLAVTMELGGLRPADVYLIMRAARADCLAVATAAMMDKRADDDAGLAVWARYVGTMCERCRVNAVDSLARILSCMGIDSGRLRETIEIIEPSGPEPS